jgi:hypothetical protein
MTNGQWIAGIKRRLSSAVAIVGSLIGVVQPAAAQSLGPAKLKTRMTHMGAWFMSYGRSLPPYQMNLLVVANEGCLLEIQNVLGDNLPERPEFGVYFWKNPPAEAESLRQLMLSAEAGRRPWWEDRVADTSPSASGPPEPTRQAR